MFGYHKEKRKKFERKHQEKVHKELSNKLSSEEEDKHVKQKTEEAKRERAAARKEGVEYAEKHFAKPIEGLTPEVKRAMKGESEKEIRSHYQTANRKLLGDQSVKGIRSKSGVAFAQRKALNKDEAEARGAAHRDLERLNYDTALKKRAATFTGGEGEAIQNQLDKQIASDNLRLKHERNRQRVLENEHYRAFNRI